MQAGLHGQDDIAPDFARFIRGDPNNSGFLGLDDALLVVGYLFLGEPDSVMCEDAADADDDGRVNIADALLLLFHLFVGGAPPPEPFPACGNDASLDRLECRGYWICGTGLLVNSADMRLLPVQAGQFQMGSPLTERGRNGDELPHTVVLACDYYLSETEVTQGQYLNVMGVNPSSTNGTRGGLSFGTVLTRAVETVTWFDANEFCKRLSERENRKYRLPYEAEWEYACRAGTVSRFWFGDVLECRDDGGWFCEAAAQYMWLFDDGTMAGLAMPVGLKTPNPWGFHDMHSHMMEWCQDWYGSYPREEVINPQGPPTGTRRIVRGVTDDPYFGLKGARSASRHSYEPRGLFANLGFRIVLELPTCAYGD